MSKFEKQNREFRAVLPKDYFSDCPPHRIIGTETEYSIQQEKSTAGLSDNIDKYIHWNIVNSLGDLSLQNSYLSNGGRLYPDLGKFIEYASAESAGPKNAVAADLAGIGIVKKIVDASKKDHRGVYRIAGSYKSAHRGMSASYNSMGTHENYMIPANIKNDENIYKYLPGYLASRFFAMGGMVQKSFNVSQKVLSLGELPIINQLERRTEDGIKPMAIIIPESASFDVVGNKQWTRLEVRFADPVMSPKSRFLSLAATSLVLRMIEHPQLIDKNLEQYVYFSEPVKVAKSFLSDLTFTKKHQTIDNKRVSALDIQKVFLDNAIKLANKIELPKDEIFAISLWKEYCTKMTNINPIEDGLESLATDYDFAALYHYLSSKSDNGLIEGSNSDTLARYYNWYRIVPEGGAIKYWSHFNDLRIVDPKYVNYLKTHAPNNTRAKIRENIIKDKNSKFEVFNWAQLRGLDANHEIINLRNAYQTEINLHLATDYESLINKKHK